MEKDANYFVVGLFVSASLMVTVGFLIWLAGFHGSGDVSRYTVHFTDPISGLNNEATVKYKGVDVGKIVAIRIAPGRSDLIKVDIEVKDDTPVRAGTEARIALQGITGQSYIELTTDSGDSAEPKRPDDERYPVLMGQGSAMAKFLDDMPDISKQLSTTLTSLDEFAHQSTKTMESLRSLTDKLKDDPSRILYPSSNKGVEIPK